MDKREHILVPLDFSPVTPDILKIAEGVAERTGSKVVLLHVVEPFDALKQRAPVVQTDVLEDYARLMKRIPHQHVSWMALEGDPIQVILNMAESYPCWAIVMGRGGSKEHPGHVAASVHKRFKGKTHLISRCLEKKPVAA